MSGGERARTGRLLLAVTVLTWLATLPRLWGGGTNVVTKTYRWATTQLYSGLSPYQLPIPGGDRYDYAPWGALLYSPFAFLSPSLQSVLWALLNCFVFWLGLFLWVKPKKWTAWIVLGLVAASLELNISVLYQQINPFIIGATLVGLALYRDQRWIGAGIVLTMVLSLKPLALLMVPPLLMWGPGRFWLGWFLGGAIAVLSPAFIVGWERNFSLHQTCVLRMAEAMQNVRPIQLDIGTQLTRLGVSFAEGFRWVVFAVTLGFLTAFRPQTRRDWAHWISLGCLGVLLWSPRAESPTFVFMAPAYALLFWDWSERPKTERALGLFFLCLTLVVITVCYTDLWYKPWWIEWRRLYLPKTLGALALWGFVVSDTLSVFLRGHGRVQTQ